MGKGIALSIKLRFPEAYVADCTTAKGDPTMLGSISVAKIRRGDRTFHIVNGYTRFHWRGQGVKADYVAIRQVMRTVKAAFTGKSIGYQK
jgi:O-acetyl-ADP-ribose deacetylase (regulator of RNase III)